MVCSLRLRHSQFDTYLGASLSASVVAPAGGFVLAGAASSFFAQPTKIPADTINNRVVFNNRLIVLSLL